MALSYIGVSAAPVFGTTTATATLPAGYTVTAGDRAYLLCVHKRPSLSTPATPAGWTSLGMVQVGTGTAGAAAGPLGLTIFYRDLVGGDTIPAVTITGTGAVIGVSCAVYRKAAGEFFDHGVASMTDTGSSTTFSGDFSADPGLTAGDQVLFLTGLTISTTTAATWSVDNPQGATFSAFTEHHDAATTSGDDLRYVLNSGSVTAGTATAPIHTTCTTSGSNTGGAYLLRVRATASAIIRSASTGTTATNSTDTIVPKPAGLAVGDLMIGVQLRTADDLLADMVPPSGFVVQASQSPTDNLNIPPLEISTKVATSGDVAAANFTFVGDLTTSGQGSAMIIAVQAGTYDASAPVTFGTFNTAGSTLPNLVQTAPSISANANDRLLTIYGMDCAASDHDYPASGGTAPSGMTRVAWAQDVANYCLLGAYTEARPTAGATGTKTVTPGIATSTADKGWVAHSLLINPKAPPVGQATLVATATLTAGGRAAVSSGASLAATATIGTAGAVTTPGVPEFIDFYLATIGSQTTTTTVSFTPAAGEIILVKCFNGAVDSPNVDTVSGGDLTYSFIHNESGAAGTAEVWIYAAQVPDPSPGAMTVSATWTGSNGRHGIIVERYRNAEIPTAVGNSPRMGTGAPSASITTVADNSIVSWLNADFLGVATAATYTAGSIEISRYLHAQVAASSAYLPTTTKGAYTVGQTAPTGQAWTLAAVELRPVGVGAPAVAATLAVTADITAGGDVTPGAGGGTATFGQTAESGSETSSSADRKKVSAATPSSDGTAESITIRARVTVENTTIKGVIYADSGGAPGALLAVSDEITINSTTKQAWTANFSGANRISVTNGTPYWIGFHNKDPGTGGFAISRSGTSSMSATNTDTYSDLPTDPFGTPVLESGPIDAYVTYSLPPSGVTVTGDATLASTATLTAAGYVERPSGASLAATATIGAAGVPTFLGAATVASTATISAAGYTTEVGAATVAGSATVTAAGYVVRPSAASLVATATLTAAGLRTTVTAASLAGTATVSAAGYVALSSAASLATTATVASVGYVVRPSAASVALTASVSAAGYITVPSGASLAATATALAAGYVVQPSAATLTGAATVTAGGLTVLLGAATLAGTATITAASDVVPLVLGAASLAATASVTAAGYVARPSEASVTATATITAAAIRAAVSGAALAGSATVTAAGVSTFLGAVSLAATTSITAAGAGVGATGVELALSANLTTAGYITAPSAVSLSANASITSAAYVDRRAAAVLAGSATIVAAGFYVRPGGASLASTATITAAGVGERPSAVTLGSTAAITAAGILALPAPAAVTATASITAAGALTLPAAAAVAVSAALVAAGAGAAPGGAVLALSAALAAAGYLLAPSPATLAVTGQVSAAGYVGRLSGAVLDTSATLTTSAFIDRLSAATVSVLASLTAAGEGAAPGGAALVLSADLAATGISAGISGATLLASAAITAAGYRVVTPAAALAISATATAGAATVATAVMVITAAINATGAWTRVSPAALAIAATIATAAGVASFLVAHLALSAAVLAGPQLLGQSAAVLDLTAEIIAVGTLTPETTPGVMTAPVRPSPRIDRLGAVTASMSGLARATPRMTPAPNGRGVRMDGVTAHKSTITRGQ